MARERSLAKFACEPEYNFGPERRIRIFRLRTPQASEPG
jgi:hypothetical protein